MNRLTPLETLRGFLALWVLFGHVVSFTYDDADVAAVHMSLLRQPILAVYVFIILSGFVIMFLLDHSRLSYGGFMLRRFLRIGPVYYLAVGAGALTLTPQLGVLQAMPWRHSDVVQAIAIHQESLVHFWQHLVVHLTLLQGVVPLAFSDYTLLGPAWSIALEWQFYLVAPLIFWLLATRRWHGLAALAAGFAVLRYMNFGGVGFIGNQFGYFAVGIASYFAFKHGDKLRVTPAQVDFLAVAGAAILYFFFSAPWPLMLWLLVLLSITFGQRGVYGLTTRPLNWLLNVPAFRWLGQVSYSLYMSHMLILYAVMGTVLHYQPAVSKSGFFLLVLPATLAATIATSAVTYYAIEVPGIRLGKRYSAAPKGMTEVSLKVTP